MPTDKLLHLLVGIAIAAVVAVVVATIGKTLWDKTGRGTSELLDAVSTIAGGAALLGYYSAFERYV
jgi:hypothetical protein